MAVTQLQQTAIIILQHYCSVTCQYSSNNTALSTISILLAILLC